MKMAVRRDDVVAVDADDDDVYYVHEFIIVKRLLAC